MFSASATDEVNDQGARKFSYGSVCSGIGAPEVAWSGLGWDLRWVSEIEPFPSSVLSYRFPGVTNHGDFTRIDESAGPVDLLVGGTPCQAFSIAGKRKGLADHRSNLAIEYSRLARRIKARWLVWENVPGVLSSNGGGDFATFLGSLTGRDDITTAKGSWGKFGIIDPGSSEHYGVCWRVLDAQNFGVPQRRRRVFLVGYSGDWRPSAGVFLEPGSPIGNLATCGGTKEHSSGSIEDSTSIRIYRDIGFSRWKSGVGTLTAHDAKDGYCAGLVVDSQYNIRRLMPLENERLQGFPDNWTLIPVKRIRKPKPAVLAKWQAVRRLAKIGDDFWILSADSPRYWAVGNSMAVPCMRWIGERIRMVESVVNPEKPAIKHATCTSEGATILTRPKTPRPSPWVAKDRLRPPIKIHGGKHYLASRILSTFTDHTTYVEAFGGGLSVFLDKRPCERSVIHDSNPGLYDLYYALKHEAEWMIAAVNRLPYTKEVFERSSIEAITRNDDVSMRALGTIIRSRFSRGGMGKDFAWSDRLRGGQPGDVNSWETYKALLPKIAAKLADAVIIDPMSGWDVMELNDSETTLHYADPPYLHATRTARKVYEYEMSEADHLRFLATCNGLRGKVYISGYRSEMYDDLLPQTRWERVDFDMPNHSGQGEKKQRRVECLWISKRK